MAYAPNSRTRASERQPHTRILSGAVILACLTGVGCKREPVRRDAPAETTAPESARADAPTLAFASSAPAGAANLAGFASEPAADVLTSEHMRSLALGILTSWMRAQNMRDKDTYRALYHPSEFKGIKRVRSGKLQHFDHAAWMKDRMAMFDTPFEVTTEQPVVETWLDHGSTLRTGVSRVSFTQRWRNAKYADHGPKSMLIWREPRFGFQFIVFEEMLQSQSGWNTTPLPLDSPSTRPASTAPAVDFSQPLSALGLTFQTAPSQGDAASQSPHVATFAQALLAAGPMNCMSYVGYDECGDTQYDWSGVQSADFTHACTRRAALLAVLRSGKLSPEHVRALQANLTQLVALDEPDSELVTALTQQLARLPQEELFPYVAASVRARSFDPAFAKLYELLTPPHALALAIQHARPEIVAHLDPTIHAAGLARVHSKTRLPRDTMLLVVNALAQAKDTDALRALANDDECNVAMLAADALAQLGEAQFLPHWADANLENATTIVCRLNYDPNGSRRTAELTRFMHPQDHPRLLELHIEIPWGLERSAELEANPPTKEEQEQITRVESVIGEHQGVAKKAAEQDLGRDDIDTIARSAATNPEVSYERGSLHFQELNGHVYVKYVGWVYIEDNTCPC